CGLSHFPGAVHEGHTARAAGPLRRADMSSVIPVLLSGGSGTRLWPVSRKSFPKQFAPLTGEESPFQASALRLSGPRYAPPLVLTNADFRFIVTEQLAEAGITPAGILIEPAGRNTAPAI